MSVPATAGLPSQMWLGVEQVKIACTFNGSEQAESSRRKICRSIVEQASRLTDYPVALASPADLEQAPANLRRQDKQLLLRVALNIVTDRPQPAAAIMTVKAERLGLRRWSGPQTKPVRVPLVWKDGNVEVQDSAEPLGRFLARAPGSGGPERPRSDRL